MAAILPPPGLDSVRVGLAPFSAELLAVTDLMAMARSVEDFCDGPTEAALLMLQAHVTAKGIEWQHALGRALLTAALLEASRG